MEAEKEENYSFGYCKLCRAKEIELYGTCTDQLAQHKQACEAAGCKHPVAYKVKKKSS